MSKSKALMLITGKLCQAVIGVICGLFREKDFSIKVEVCFIFSTFGLKAATLQALILVFGNSSSKYPTDHLIYLVKKVNVWMCRKKCSFGVFVVKYK